MWRARLATLLAITLLAPAGALAQSGGSNPFGPLPQPQQPLPEQPGPQPVDRQTDEDGLGGTAFWLIVGSTGMLLVGIGAVITRDMRRTAGTSRKLRRRRGTGRPDTAGTERQSGSDAYKTGSQRAKAKAQQRAKTKAARKQRRKTRSR